LWSAEKYGNISHIARGTRIKVNKEGEFITKGRIEDIEYDEESESESESESDSSESGDSYSYSYDSDEESYETDVSSEEVEI
tara:strand:- start:124 stop:369 length:246 start_codon:yes stop_codon:yes gene_type:complete